MDFSIKKDRSPEVISVDQCGDYYIRVEDWHNIATISLDRNQLKELANHLNQLLAESTDEN